MKSLKFSPHLVPLILSGKKTCTWRLWDDKDLKKGDKLAFIKRPELTQFAKARVTEAYEKKMGEINEYDKRGHKKGEENKHETEEEMYKRYSNYYKRDVGPETPVKIVRFELLD